MKVNKLRFKPASIAKTRWAAYATAGAATALAGSQSVDAAIHYSGVLNVKFPPHRDRVHKFQLDQPGDFLSFAHFASFPGHFAAYGIVSGYFRGYTTSSRGHVSKLSFGQEISAGYFVSYGGDMYQFGDRGTGYVGFRFNNGAGIQYGWARVSTSGQPGYAFIVRDYAYADPGEPIRAGQRSSSDEQAPDEGSLGWLALGAAGLLAWRKNRSRNSGRRT
jgi:MYXO-CTERM domain-containing protein